MAKRTEVSLSERADNPFNAEQGQLIKSELESYNREAMRTGKPNITQAELAARAGLTQPQMSRVLNGRRGASRPALARIAEALGVSMDALTPPLQAEDDPKAPWGSGRSGSPMLPQGLAGFLERHEAKEKIDRRERWYLENSRFRAEPWVTFDDEWWLSILRMWRSYLAKQTSTKKP